MAKSTATVIAKAKKLAADVPAAIEKLQERIDVLREEQRQLNEFYKATHGKSLISESSAPASIKAAAKPAKVPAKRVRRSGNELKAIAEEVHTHIKKAGAEGLTATEIKAQVKGLDGIPSLKAFLGTYLGKGAIKTTGEKRNMKYRVPTE